MPALDRNRDRRRRAASLVEAELDALRVLRPDELHALAERSPLEATRSDISLSTHVRPEGERVLVLVEAWRGRRTLATGGFAMDPDGTARTPH